MKIITIIFVLIFFLTGCLGSDSIVARAPKPEDLIPQDKLTEILIELVKLEGHVEVQYGIITKYNKLMVLSGDSLLASYHVDKDRFEKSMEYYGSRQELMKSINDDILDELNKELGELESENDFIVDSISD